MNILITSDWYDPAVNGVVRSVKLLYEELKKKGHDVRILTLSQNHSTYMEGDIIYFASVDARIVYPGARVKLPLTRGIMKFLGDWKPDVVHSQCEFSTFGPAVEMAERFQCPLVHTYHTVYEDYTHYVLPGERLGRTAVKYFTLYKAHKCDVIIVPTKKVQNILVNYGVNKPVAVVPTGIDLHKFSEKAPSVGVKIRKRAGIPEDAFVLVAIGRLAAEKNAGELIRIFSRVHQDNTYLMFVGDGPARKELEAQTAAFHLENRVCFTGMVSPEEVADYYQAGDLFVCASNSETQGLTYLEALSSGVPALCKADACLEDLIINDYNGCQWENDEDFLQFLDKCEGNAALLKELSQNARKKAEEYAADRFADNALHVYEAAILAKA